MLERLIADGLAGRFPAEEVDILKWKEMLKRAQDLQLKLRKRLNQRAARSSAAPAMAEERQEESWAPVDAPREARGPEAAPHRCRDAGPDQFIQLKPIRAMSELSDLIWGRLGLSAVRALPLEEPHAPSAEAAVTELRPRGAAWSRELPRPAVNDEDEDEDRVELTHYFLRLAPWIVRPASPSARAGTMMAAIRTKFEVALERSRFPESDWTVVGITAAYLLTAPSQQLADMPAPPPPNEAGGCWKGAARDPGQEEGHLEPSERGPPLLHVVRPRPLPRGRRAQQAPAVKGHKLLGLLLPRSHAHQHRRLRGVQVPKVHGPLRLLAAPPRYPVLSRDG